MKIGIEIDNLVFYVHMPLMFVPVRCRNGPKYWDNTDIVL